MTKLNLSQAARDARVQHASYNKSSKGSRTRASTVNHIAWERGESIVVHSRSKEDLANLLIAWTGVQHTGISLVEFGGRRGFNLKCAPREDTNTKDEDGPRNSPAKRSGTSA